MLPVSATTEWKVLLELIAKGEDEYIPPAARECLMALAAQIQLVKRQILEIDRRVLPCRRTGEVRANRSKPFPASALLLPPRFLSATLTY